MEYNNKQIESNSISSNINYNLKFFFVFCFSIKIKSNQEINLYGNLVLILITLWRYISKLYQTAIVYWRIIIIMMMAIELCDEALCIVVVFGKPESKCRHILISSAAQYFELKKKQWKFETNNYR